MSRLSRSFTASMLTIIAVGCSDPSARTAPTASQTATAPAPVASSTATATASAAEASALDKELERASDVEIPGGKEAGCVARAVQKQVRIICSARDGRPAPDAIVQTRANRRLDVRAEGGPAAHVETIFEPGLDATATFVWGDKARELTMRWPEGAPRPASYGSFGPEKAFDNPCKPHGLEGFGSKGAPCRFKDLTMLTFAWTNDFGPEGAKPENKKPLFDVENKSTATIQTITVSLSFFDGGGKPVEQDTLGDPFRPTTAYTHDKRIAPKATIKAPLGPEQPRVPPTVKRIDVTVHEFSTSSPEAYFALEKADPKGSVKAEK